MELRTVGLSASPLPRLVSQREGPGKGRSAGLSGQGASGEQVLEQGRSHSQAAQMSNKRFLLQDWDGLSLFCLRW